MSETNRSAATGDRSRVHRLEFSVDWPPGHAAAYLLADDEPILVDAGMAGDEGRAELVAGLEAVGTEPAAVDHLLLTHAHIDHVGQVPTLLEAGDPTVYAPRRVREQFERDLETVAAATEANLREAGVDPDRLDAAVDEVLEIHRGVRRSLPLEAVDVWIDDGPVTVGDREFDPIYTPGHQITHYCYGTTLGDDRVVFSGDMAIEPFRAAAIHANFDDGLREGIDAYVDALERLREYSFDRVYPGHGPIHEAYAATIERAQSDLEDRLDDCVARLAALCDRRDRAIPALEIARDRTDDVRRRVLALREIVAALATLERRGRVDSWLEDGVRYYEPA